MINANIPVDSVTAHPINKVDIISVFASGCLATASTAAAVASPCPSPAPIPPQAAIPAPKRAAALIIDSFSFSSLNSILPLHPLLTFV